jgi:hypothetical protein
MSITNALKAQIDLPVWEWTRFAPAVSSALSASCAADNSNFHVQHGRYIYYLIAATSFWRYDTWTDTYLQLSSPPTTPLTWSSMRFMGSQGFEGRVLAASSSSVTIPAYSGKALKTFDLMIVAGTGAGQRRVITDVAEPVVADSGIVTAVVAGSSLTDSTKTWTVNQWAGYQVRITFGTGVSQVRRILYNSATVLTFADTNKYPEDTFCNPMTTSPAILATAGSQSVYAIESSVVSIDSNWTVTPDNTSRFRVASGAILLFSSAAATPFYTVQWYDVLSDTWYVKTAQTLNVAAVGTDGTIERTNETTSLWDRGLATSGTTTTLTDTAKSWTTNQWVGYYVQIFSGTGSGQLLKVTANTSNALTFATATAPDATSRYIITGFDAGTASSGGSTSLTDSTKAWATNRWANYAVRIIAGTGIGQVQTIASNTGTALTVMRPWVTNPDSTSQYTIIGDPDKAYLMLGANAATLIYNLEDDLATYGRRQDSGAARIGSAQLGTWKPVALASITRAAAVATATTVNPHNFKTGDTITHAGASDTLYNIAATITVTGANTYTYTMAGTPGANAVFGTLSTTTLIDASKNWTVNEWAGAMCYMANTAGATPTGQVIQIASNTANTLTFVAAVTIPANGVTRYVLTPRPIIGTIDSGIATGSQSTTTLQDTSKAWVVNIHAGRKVKFLSSTGQAQELSITSNTSNTLTFALATAPVAAATSYAIIQPPVRGTGIELNWAYGMSDTAMRGKYMFIARGGAALGFDRLDLTTDQWVLLSITPQVETLSSGSMYAYDGGDRLYFTKDITQRCYYIDLTTNTMHGASIYPYAAGTAIIGNRMEIFTTIDGLKYMWLNRHSFQECFRQLLWF